MNWFTEREIDINRRYHLKGVWKEMTYQGVPIRKYPTDLWEFSEIIHKTRPDVIVECGTFMGGSALFFRDTMYAAGHIPRVITIDIEDVLDSRVRKESLGIHFAIGDSTSQEMFEKVYDFVGDGRAMVVLDSDHQAPHVLKEMRQIGSLVTPGCYLVVEDTFLSVFGGSLTPEPYPHGTPHEAVNRFLEDNGHEFVRDLRPHRHILTANPGGWLMRRNP